MELFRLLGTIAIDGADNAKREIGEVNDTAREASSGLKGTLGKVGNTALAIGKTVAIGVGVASTAIIGITQQAVDSYGEYEQLVGGVETLFKDSADVVLGYAQKAYQTAGMSANEYMATVTSFSASLLQSLNGDTAKSAEIADMAIQDMSDNANKMGTNMQMIQNAYQGFAKQNYTMLDNLKLGYGGTKAEMERLLADAERLTGIKYDINSFSDVVSAIHVIQNEMGITGTTAEEASKTIQGSMRAVSASWRNVLTGLADDNQDLGALIQTLIDNLVTMLGNMMPKIETIFQKIPTLITNLAPLLGQLITSLAPSLLTAVATLITNILTSLPNLLGQLKTIAVQTVEMLKENLSTSLPSILEVVQTLYTQLTEMIQTNLPIIVDKAREMMTQFGEKIKEHLPTVISKALDMLLGFSQTVLENAPRLIAGGMEMIKNIVQGIIDSLPTLIQKAPQIIINFANTISKSMQIIFAKGVEIVWNIIKGIIKSIPDLIKNMPKIIEAIFSVWNAINWMNLGKNLMNGIKNGIKNMGGALKQSASNVFNSFKTGVQNIFTRIGEIIKSPIFSAKTKVLALVGELQHGVMSVFNALKGSVSIIFNGIKTAMTSPITTAKNMIKGIIDTIKGFFNFKVSLPKIPLPHFAINPSGWKIGDLLKGSIPKLGISWHKKAMDNPMVLDEPTLFGFQNGNFLGAGEAGAEVVAGRDTLMSMIQRAVSANNARNEELLEKILALLAKYIPNLNLNPQLVLDTGVLVSELAPKMDRELGVISRMKERGR